MGSPADFAAMVSMVEHRGIKPEVDSATPLAQGAAVIASMARSPQFGKLVLEIA
jgi:NADPH:quinone reductase-like Zn-dependent oxidoreductase